MENQYKEKYLEGLLEKRDVLIVTAEDDVKPEYRQAFLLDLVTKINCGLSFLKFGGRGQHFNNHVDLSEPVLPNERIDYMQLPHRIYEKDLDEAILYDYALKSLMYLRPLMDDLMRTLGILSGSVFPVQGIYSRAEVLNSITHIQRGVLVVEDISSSMRESDHFHYRNPIETAKELYGSYHRDQSDYNLALILCDLKRNRVNEPIALMADSHIHLTKGRRGNIGVQVIKAQGKYLNGKLHRNAKMLPNGQGLEYSLKRSMDRKTYKPKKRVKFMSPQMIEAKQRREQQRNSRYSNEWDAVAKANEKRRAERLVLLERDEAEKARIKAMTPEERATHWEEVYKHVLDEALRNKKEYVPPPQRPKK
jgi:hypothetical protein